MEYRVSKEMPPSGLSYPIGSKEKPPRGLSYPIGRSVLDAALLTAGVETVDDADLMLHRPRTSDAPGRLMPVILVEYDGEETARPWRARGAITIRIFAVPSGIKHAVAAELQDGALAELADWVASVPGRAETWRMVDHRYQLRVGVDGPQHLVVTED